MAVVVVVTLAACLFLWPPHSRVAVNSQLVTGSHLYPGVVAKTTTYNCNTAATAPSGAGAAPASQQCRQAFVNLDGGPDRGHSAPVDFTPGSGVPALAVGDRVLVTRAAGPGNQPIYGFADFQRGLPMAILALLFALFVVAVGRWRGVGALAGLVITFLVLVRFILPAILEGRSAVGVSLVGAALIVLVVQFVAHGVSARTTTAVLGTLASLLLTGGLAALAVYATHLSGLASDETQFLQTAASKVSLDGLILGGMIIGAVGVLNDITVTQASAVWEIHFANRDQGWLDIYESAMRIGRDHIASTVYTLVLAYAGAALPTLLIFSLAGRSFNDLVVTEAFAEEIVRTLVGSIGLVAAVPLTTALAALVVTSRRDEANDPVEPVPAD